MEKGDDQKTQVHGGGQLKFEPPTLKELRSSKNIDHLFWVTGVIFILSYALVPFIGYGELIASSVGITSFLICIISFSLIFKIHDIKTDEGKMWILFILGMVMILASRIADVRGDTFSYFIIRLTAYPLLLGGIILKVHMSGINLESNEKGLLSITFLGWWLLVIITAIAPIFERGFDYTIDMFAIFAIMMMFGIMMASIIILSVGVKGWYYFSVGVTLLGIGEVLHVPAYQYDMLYPGTPVTLFWYMGFLFTGYGAYHLRREYLKLIAM